MLEPGRERVATPPFVHLHNHSHCSFLNGTCPPGELVRMAGDDGNPAVALTDHGNLFGLPQFVEACWSRSVHPIVGCELSVASDGGAAHHMTLLARDLAGYRNLVALVNAAHQEGFANDPVVTEAVLAQHAEGLVALSGCAKGAIPSALLSDELELAAQLAEHYRGWFGAANFYLELQHPNRRPEQVRLNDLLADLGARLELPLVATGNTHHRSEGHHRAMVESSESTADLDDIPLASTKDRFLTAVEMVSAVGHYPGAIANTLRIADACTLTFPLPCISDKADNSTRRRRLVQALSERKHFLSPEVQQTPNDPAYMNRLKGELDALEKNGWSMLPLAACAMLQELNDWRPVDGGPEATASLVMYLAGLSSVDPVRFGINGPGIVGLGSGFAAPDLTLRVARGDAERMVVSGAQQLEEEGVVQGTDLRHLTGGEVLARVARGMGATSQQIGRALTNLAPTGEVGSEWEWAHALCREAPELDPVEVAFALLIDKHAPAGPTAEHSLIIPPGGDASLLPVTRLADGRVVSHYCGRWAHVLGFGSVTVSESSSMTFARNVLHRIHRSQLLNAWPLWSRLPLDDGETWHALAQGRVGDFFDKDEPVATHLFKLLAPADLNTLALALALLRERAGGLHRALYGLFEDGVPALGGGGLPSADEQMLATASNRSDVLAHYRQQSVWGLEEVPEWVGQLAARCFDDWDSFAANFWVLSRELYCASRDYFEANFMDRDPGPPLPPLFFSRSVALHYAAAVYKHTYLYVHYARHWAQVAGGGGKGSLGDHAG